jgi:hypothetical protein
MIWFSLAVLFVLWNGVILIGRLFGTEGVMVAVMLGLAALSVILFGGLASIAFSLGLPLAGWLFTLLMIGQLIQIGWNTYQGLRR